MQFRLNIRNRLILTVFLIVIGLSLQIYVSSISNADLAYIQDQKDEYLERDNAVANSLNSMIVNTNDLIETLLSDLVFGLLQNDDPPAIQELGTYQEDFNSLLTMLRERNATGYNLDSEELNQIPFVYGIREARNESIRNLLTPGIDGVYSSISQIQLSVYSVILGAQSELENLKNRYIVASENYFVLHNQFLLTISDLSAILEDLELLVLSHSDINLVEDVMKVLIDIRGEFSNYTELLHAVSRQLQQEDSTNPQYLDLPDEFLENVTSIQSSIQGSFNDLNALSLNTTQSALNSTLQETFFNNLFFPISSQTGQIAHPIMVVLEEFIDLRAEVATFFSSHIVLSLENTQTTLVYAKTVYDVEHANFIQQYDRLEEELIANSQTLSFGIIFALGVIVFLMALPAVLKIDSSTRRLSRNMRRIADGDLSIKLRDVGNGNEFDILEQSFNTLVTNLREVLGVIRQSSSQLAGISEELAAGTEEASASLGSVSETVASITNGATQQNILLERLAVSMANLRREIQRASLQIEESSSHVLNLSQRTNILGLNASISAAKAGEFAKGFGIVAEEIRELANSSKKSSSNISELVDEIVTRLRNLSGEMTASINQVKSVAEETAQGSEKTSLSAQEQVIMLGEISETSNDLAELANSLDGIVQRFFLKDQ